MGSGVVEPIAIVGLDCRFPGGISSPGEYWDCLDSGRCFVAPLPRNRGWDLGWLTDPNLAVTEVSRVRLGGFFDDDDVGGFDAGFFGVSPREAVLMDPQQRLLLESVWTAIERARIAPGALRGSSAGVFIGISDCHYFRAADVLSLESGGVDAYVATGGVISVASGRISYVLDLRGPTFSVDTACSSSLVAAHLAVRALRAGDCDVAIAGGVCVMATSDVMVQLGRAGALTGDGRCKAFAAEADGFVPAEGVVTVVLMPLDRAVETGRPVLAVVRGSAINHDGGDGGLTVPSGAAQQRLITDALADAALSPGQVDLVEAHGTGTQVGDPIEASSILAAYGGAHTPDQPVWIGSAKSNIGHTQAAAGLAGLAKVVLAMQHETMPCTLHAANPTPEVDWSAGTMRLLQQARDWPRGDRVRRAGVFAYGISGTNAHMIVEEAPELTVRRRRSGVRATRPTLWPLSADSVAALSEQARTVAEWVRERPDSNCADIGWSLASTRTALPERVAVVGEDTKELLARLDAVADSANMPEPLDMRARACDGIGTVFVFPGQGAQWLGMGARLLEQSAVFAQAAERCNAALRPWLDFEVMDVLRDRDGVWSLENSAVVQPALFAMYVSLAELWRVHGVIPAAVIGHSQGEIAAAHVAGALTLEDAARAMAAHSQTLSKITGIGAMVSLGLPVERTQNLLGRFLGRLQVAVLNGPTATVAAGDKAAAAQLLADCESQGITARLLPVDYASHSAHMDAVREDVLRTLGDLRPQPTTVEVMSTVTGQPVASQDLRADYWYRGMRQPVLFDGAVRHALRQGYRHFIEMSPHPILVGAVHEIAADIDIAACVLGTLHRGEGDMSDFTRALGQAHVCGVDLDWAALYPDAREVDLPAYRFQRRSYWAATVPKKVDLSEAGLRATGHPWLTATMDLADGTTVHTGQLSPQAQPWLADHAVYGRSLLPATGMLELLLHAADESGCGRLEDIAFHTPIRLFDDNVDIQVRAGQPDDSGRRPVSLHSRTQGTGPAWTCNADAVAIRGADIAPTNAAISPWPPRDAKPVDVAGLYQELNRAGYNYGPAFRRLVAAWRLDDDTQFSEVSLGEEEKASEGFTVHPALLDAALHVLVNRAKDNQGDGQRILLPYAIASAQVWAPGATTLCTTVTCSGPETVDIRSTDSFGGPVVAIEGLRLRPSTARVLRAGDHTGDAIVFRPVWRPVTAENSAVTSPESLTVIGSAQGLPAGQTHHSMTDLIGTLATNIPAPELIWLDCRDESALRPAVRTQDLSVQVTERLRYVLTGVQAFLAEPRLENARLVLLTRNAHSTCFGEAIGDLSGAACAGMLRSAQKEHPGRLQLIDISGDVPEPNMLAAAAATGQPQIALRGKQILVQRLSSARDDESLALPIDGVPWRLSPADSHTFDDIAPIHAPDLEQPVATDRVRIRVQATGVNFRDTLVCLGLVEGSTIGFEVAGTVVEAGRQVHGLAAGDRVLAFVLDQACGGYAPIVDVDHRYVFSMPPGWTAVTAAGNAIAFITAYHGLYELAKLQRGEKMLIHAAAGGVGMAAVQLAQARGADIYATASEPKHRLVAALGVRPEHIADSRSLSFESQLRQATGGVGFDVVMGSLTAEFVDASLRLLRPGGRYAEMGLRDLRGSDEVHAQYPNVTYRAFELLDAPPQTFRRVLDGLVPMFEQKILRPIAMERYNVRYARQVLRRLSQGGATGKTVLISPIELDPNGTVLITGGTGTLGAVLAKHLATTYRMRHLLLVSRRGVNAPGAEELEKDLASLGAAVTFAACDAADRANLAHVIAGIPAAHPLTAVVHAAGTLDDGLFVDITPERLDTVLQAKVRAAVNLHELTRDIELQAFVLYSSLAGMTGLPGQSNYAAANCFLDALAHHRRRLGLPAISISWGFWQQTSALTAQMGATDRARIARLGFDLITTAHALAGFDTALDVDQPHVAVTTITSGTGEQVSDLLADLPRQRTPARGADRSELSQQTIDRAALLAQSAHVRYVALVALVCTHTAAILGHTSPDDIVADQPFRRAGIDSLATVELRTRLNAATGTRLAATALLDHPTPAALARHIDSLLTGSADTRDDTSSAADGSIRTLAVEPQVR
jgi:acyl transferase domain-containing protein/NADPH:quinone reductase-like Zn-dependent oxidoreductase/NADP-dependent 3-hydroxy acid dehydrogenase YdfG/acyl carrier protein